MIKTPKDRGKTVMDDIVLVFSDYTAQYHPTWVEVNWVYHRQSTGLIPYYCHELYRTCRDGINVIAVVDSRLNKEIDELWLSRFIEKYADEMLGEK